LRDHHGQPGGQEVDRHARDQLIAAEGDGGQPMQPGHQQRGGDAGQQADPDRPRDKGEGGREKAAISILPSSPMSNTPDFSE
jgi:hypothetical protein